MRSFDAVLATLAASYSQPEEPTVTHTVVAKTTTVSRKVRASAAPTASVPSTNSAPPPVVMALPEKGSLDAKGFILATRKAKSRDEVIQAIAAFVGYDAKRDFGSQEMSAKLAAQRAMNPSSVVAAPYRRSIVPSTAGYVAGMPDYNRRKLADLRGREELAAKARDTFVREARDRSRSWAERWHSIALARLEAGRLIEIREELKAF